MDELSLTVLISLRYNQGLRHDAEEKLSEMIYALVHYPDVDTRGINQLREKYDPQAGWIGPHVTLMFPVPESVGEDNLVRHIENVLSRWRPFPIHLRGLEKSWDDYLFLLVREGSESIVRLHDEIYTGVLAGQCREDAAFVPHLTLGVFSKDAGAYARALEEARRLDLDHRCVVDKLHLVKVNDERSRVVSSREFSLSE
ncbi:MAG TPA: 2'-5' RNA ligase family protein [Pyrinomonadaceae bacterium]|jgi:2'-5' RNA ligase